MRKLKHISLLFLFSACVCTAQEKILPAVVAEEPAFYLCIKESAYAPFTNAYIKGFPTTSVLFSFSPKASESFFSLGFSYARYQTDYMGFHLGYKFLSNYMGTSPHNFVFSAGYKYLLGQYVEYGTFNGVEYDHRVNFHNIHFGVGYLCFFGKNDRCFISPMAHLSANWVGDDMDNTNGKGSPNYDGFYKKKIEGMLVPYLEIEIGIKLKGGRNN